jgi:hypothetical protein
MNSQDQEIVSAQAVLNKTGASDSAQSARTSFADAGFEVGALVGNSFSITGPLALFEQVFKTQLRRTERGGLQSAQKKGAASEELPISALPAALRKQLATVTFTRPPDFGPTYF